MASILVVEDSEANIHILQGLLKRKGYQVQVARSGMEALDWLADNHPDIILMDISMPGIDGYETCRRVKADERLVDIPIIFISALDETEKIVKAFEVGGADYITKPFRFMEVLARVENHLTIAEQRQKIQDLRDQDRKQFDAINKMKTHFIGAATHDLKNPLMVILGYVALMERQKETKDNTVYQRSLQAIRDGVRRMSSLVGDMLDLVQMEGEADLVKEPVNLRVFLTDCVNGFEVVADDVTLTLNPPDKDIQCAMDVNRMKRVVDNLISNAIKYTDTGGSVTVSSKVEDDHAIIEVTDTGLGIPEDALPRLFETFYRVPHEKHRNIEGTGLGLAIVKTIVEQHGGQVAVRSKLGEGSTFSVRLPMQIPTPEPTNA